VNETLINVNSLSKTFDRIVQKKRVLASAGIGKKILSIKE
jgi:hypothetical protein